MCLFQDMSATKMETKSGMIAGTFALLAISRNRLLGWIFFVDGWSPNMCSGRIGRLLELL